MAVSIRTILLLIAVLLHIALAQNTGYLPPSRSHGNSGSSDLSNDHNTNYDSIPEKKFAQQSGAKSSSNPARNSFESSQNHNDYSSLNPSSSNIHAAVSTDDQNAIILKDVNIVDLDGVYKFEYETSNGISAKEEGHTKALDDGSEAEVSDGSFSYTAPNGEQISLSYVADETGFHPVGDHLPTPPPIPEAIQRALEYLKTHGEQQEY